MPAHSVNIVAVFVPEGTVGIEDLNALNALNAFTQNGTLYISGLLAGAEWRVYNIFGAMVYQGTSSNPSEGGVLSLPLPGRGVYIVVSGDRVVKVTN
jgi:hypothetical protein